MRSFRAAASPDRAFRTSSIVPSPLVRKEAPAFALQTYSDGSRLALGDLRGFWWAEAPAR